MPALLAVKRERRNSNWRVHSNSSTSGATTAGRRFRPPRHSPTKSKRLFRLGRRIFSWPVPPRKIRPTLLVPSKQPSEWRAHNQAFAPRGTAIQHAPPDLGDIAPSRIIQSTNTIPSAKRFPDRPSQKTTYGAGYG